MEGKISFRPDTDKRQILNELMREKGFRSIASCVDYLISTNPEYMKKELESIQNASDDDISENGLVNDQDDDVNIESEFRPKFSGKDSAEIRLSAKELGVNPTQYLLMCHKNMKPVIFDFNNENAMLLAQRFDEWDEIIKENVNANLSILKLSGGVFNENDVDNLESKNEALLQIMLEIRNAISDNISENKKGYIDAVKQIKTISKKNGQNFNISKKRKSI